ncbi:hypothetical protein SBOR_2559 [Sclerotinia borealis F-4128]|uniref:Major facilitator superfamily (MFS) profile domain-containing protein n=1 Tax=Sclerotinia borealis (strain F-4128) TaxID=1432307 RepID=W9CM02_SCLBF|nr:hypothetical protein SBOR_2559 [Sclerotinia borealis F-4128]
MKSKIDPEKAPETVVTTSADADYLVTFITPHDPINPKCWPTYRKWITTPVLSSTGFNRIAVSTIMAPALHIVASELHMTSLESVMAMSVYLLATAFGPLIIGPLSELYGRRVVLHTTNMWFLIWNIVCGFAHTKGLLIAARLMAGLGASTIYALGGGVLGDVWRPEERGRSLGIYSLLPLFGAAAGPILGGYITELSTWRWMFWSTSIFQAVMIVISIPFFWETHGPTILRHEAEELRRNTGNPQYYTEVEALGKGRSVSWVLMRSLSRPVRLLLFHPIIQIQACLSAFSYGLTYITLSTYFDIWTGQYNESISTSGLHYLSMCLGEIVGAEIGGPLLDVVFRKMKERADGVEMPEFRVPIMIPPAILVPIGLFVYGWAAQKHTHWIVVDLEAFVLCFGMQIGGQAFLTAFGFPLFAPKMYQALGYGWGNSTLAFVAIAIGIPAPLGIWWYGPRLRAKALSSY